MQQRRTPNNMAVAPPPMPPWIHSTASRTSLAGLEIGLPPSPALSGRDMSPVRAPSRLGKALPPLPLPEQERESTAHRLFRNQFLSVPESKAPLIPRKNPRRFSWVSSDVSPTSASQLRPLRRTSSTIQTPISNSSASPSAPPAGSLPPSDWRQNSSAPPPLKLKHALSLSCQTNKVAQLTGCDLSSDPSPSVYQPPRFESEASISSSLYSDDVSSTTLTGRERKYSYDSLFSIVDTYSDWGSWAPSSPLTSPLLPPTPNLRMDSAVSPKKMASTSTITSQSNTRTPVPSPVPPLRSGTRQLGPPTDVVIWRTSCLKTPKRATTLDDLIELERTQLENGFIAEPPLSPLAQIAALQLKRDSGCGNSGDDGRIGRPAVRPQASMPTIPSSYHHGHVRSVSRFSENGSDDDNACSVRSVTSVRIRNGARGVRDSFVRGISGLNRPTSSRRDSGVRSRLSHMSDRDTTTTSQRTSDTSATTLSPAGTNNSHKHKHTLSASTSRSVRISEDHPAKQAKKNKTGDSVTRSWTSAFKKPFRSSSSTHRPESPLGRRKSTKRHSRMASAPAKLPAPGKFYGEGIRQEKPRIAVLPGHLPAPHGAVELSDAKKNRASLLQAKIVAASKLAAEYANRKDQEAAMSPVEQFAAVAAERRFSITGKAGKVLGKKDITVLPPPLPMSHQANLGLSLLHVQALNEPMEVSKRTEAEKKKGRFSVRAMMGKELGSFKVMAGIRSKEEKRREQLKGLIRVVKVEDEKEKEIRGPSHPNMPMRDAPKVPKQQHVATKEKEEDVKPGLKDEEMSNAAQLWL